MHISLISAKDLDHNAEVSSKKIVAVQGREEHRYETGARRRSL
jgi:hypothetical protein